MTESSQPSSASLLTAPVPPDELVGLVAPQTQQYAARLAQDAFARAFRLSSGGDDAERAAGVEAIRVELAAWVAEGESEDARALRMALLLNGIDQWGVAYSQTFALEAIAGVSELLGALRTALDPVADAKLQQQFAAIDDDEGNAIDFKIQLRRSIHLALWSAMVSTEERELATGILTRLGGMLFVLTRSMPLLGWRLVADALAHIQIQCIAHGLAADGLARECTVSLFAALSNELPDEQRQLIMAYSAEAVRTWQEARRSGGASVH